MRLKATFYLMGMILVSCAQNAVRKGETDTFGGDYPSKIIDAHAHFHSVQTKNFNQPSAEMEKAFADANVVGAIVHFSADEAKKTVVNRNTTKLKLAVCAAITPGATIEAVEKGFRDSKYQCMKVYLGYVPKYAYDPFYLPFYRMAQKYDVPVVFHTGDTYDKMAKVKYAEPLQVDEVAVQFPKVKFVVAHMGNPWIQSAAEVVYKNDNVYVDLSALMLGDLSKSDSESIEELVVKPIRWFYLYVENPKKLLFGTDWPLLEIRPYAAAVGRAIPKEHWDDVFYNNAVELFKLK